MKKIFVFLIFLVGISSMKGQDKVVVKEKSPMTYGVELGFYNGLYAKYNINPKFSVLGQLGMDYYLAFTFPHGLYDTGLTPALNISAQWYFWRFLNKDNSGMYLSLGLFGDLGKYALSKQNLFYPYEDRGGNESAGIFLKWGVETPITKYVNLKVGALINLGGMSKRQKEPSWNRDPYANITGRNEFLFDIGVSIPLN